MTCVVRELGFVVQKVNNPVGNEQEAKEMCPELLSGERSMGSGRCSPGAEGMG